MTVAPFQISESEVTNTEFLQFVEDTDYVTDAEKFGWSFCFAPLISKAVDDSIDQVGGPGAGTEKS